MGLQGRLIHGIGLKLLVRRAMCRESTLGRYTGGYTEISPGVTTARRRA
jgi:hypothetical protein